MKKLLTIALCIVFVGVMAVSAFADNGQITVTLTEGTAPEVDGVISEGEYEYSYEVAADAGVIDAAYVNNSEQSDATFVNFYLSATADCLYIATESDEASIAPWADGLFFYISAENTDNHIMVFQPGNDMFEIKSGNDNLIHMYNVGRVGGKVAFEISVSRSVLAESLGVDSTEELLVSVVQLVNVDESASFVWGVKNDEAESLLVEHFPSTGLPHVVNILEEGAQTPADDDQAPADDVQTPADDAQTPADDAQASEAKGGCGASVAAACVAMIAALGTCVAFVTKK